MKKIGTFLIAFLAMFIVVNGVKAEQTKQYKITNLLGDTIDIKQGDSIEVGGYTIDQIHVNVKVTKENINTILAQKSGDGSSLGIFYFGLEPQSVTGSSINKEYGKAKVTGSYEEALKLAADSAKKTADDLAQKGSFDSSKTFWHLALQVNYNKNGVWTPVTGTGNKLTSIEDNLKSLLEVDSISAADYGTKFIFSVPENYANVWVYRESTGREDLNPTYSYVAIDYDIEFPITASNGSNGYYYLSVEDALKDVSKLGFDEIIINDTTEVKEDVVIPEGLKINVATGKKLTFKGDVTLEPGAMLIGDGEVDFTEGKEVNYAITIDAGENGSVTTDKEFAKEDDVVTIKTIAKEGYELDKLIVMTQDGDEIKVIDGKFTMPASQVTVTATFRAITVNPATGDNIMLYIIAGISALALVQVALCLKKKHSI